MSAMDSKEESLCEVLVTEDPTDEELWEWFRCPSCNCRKFYCKDASKNAVYVHLRCMNCGTETALKIGSKAEKKRRNNRKRRQRGLINENG